MSTTTRPCPKGGWIPELQAAKTNAKKNPKSADAQLRCAEAAAVVRRWKFCKVSAQVGLHLLEDENDPKASRFKELARLAEQELSVKSVVDDDMFLRDIKPKIMDQGANIDQYNIYTGNPCFTNLNLLQYAACRGDVRLLEELVAMGAALDVPVLPVDADRDEMELCPAPPGTTALILASSQMALHKGIARKTGMEAPLTIGQKEQLERSGDCCVRLILLGADHTARIRIRGNSEIDQMYRMAGLDGKSVEDCARIAGHKGLLDALKRTADREAVLKLTQCRCGSRLPWKECHAGAVDGEAPSFTKSGDGKICWRYSPLAKCPCENTKKVHYKCCWYTMRPTYQNDADGSLLSTATMPVGPEMAPFVQRLAQMKMEGNPDDPVFPARDPSGNAIDYHKRTVDMFRGPMGRMMLQQMTAMSGGNKSRISEWDPDVFAGCIEHQDPGRFFPWNDLHWGLDKSELIVRVKEWNEALEAYCDEKNLHGAERERVVKKHAASPYAPCANSLCTAYETSVKEFKCCSKCKQVGYCSRDCQRAHWKEHKPRCVAPNPNSF